MATKGNDGATNPAPANGDDDGCKDPSDKFVELQCSYAQDVVVVERRQAALDDMKARTDAVSGIQVTYEDARAVWIKAGRQWWSTSRRPPGDWDGAKQLARARLS